MMKKQLTVTTLLGLLGGVAWAQFAVAPPQR